MTILHLSTHNEVFPDQAGVCLVTSWHCVEKLQLPFRCEKLCVIMELGHWYLGRDPQVLSKTGPLHVPRLQPVSFLAGFPVRF